MLLRPLLRRPTEELPEGAAVPAHCAWLAAARRCAESPGGEGGEGWRALLLCTHARTVQWGEWDAWSQQPPLDPAATHDLHCFPSPLQAVRQFLQEEEEAAGEAGQQQWQLGQQGHSQGDAGSSPSSSAAASVHAGPAAAEAYGTGGGSAVASALLPALRVGTVLPALAFLPSLAMAMGGASVGVAVAAVTAAALALTVPLAKTDACSAPDDGPWPAASFPGQRAAGPGAAERYGQRSPPAIEVLINLAVMALLVSTCWHIIDALLDG